MRPVVRLERGVTRAQAQAEIEALVAPVNAGDARSASLTPVLEDVRSLLAPVGRRVMAFLLASSGLVLFIGCMNLAIMLLVRGQRSLRETGVRAALGATRTQMVLPIVFESCIIGLAGAALALAVTYLTFDLLLLQVPSSAYGDMPVGVDLRVALYALALGLIGGLVVSIVPAWRAARQDAQTLIQGRQERLVRRGRLGRPLVALQVALTVVLAFGAVTTARAFIKLLNEPLGFNPKNVITVSVSPTDRQNVPQRAFYARAIEALAARSDVESVGAAQVLPMSGLAPSEGLRIAGVASRACAIGWALPGYFEAAGIPLLRGRLFDWNDVRGAADAAVVGDAAARVLFPGRDPLGETFENGSGRRFRIVGVVGDSKGMPGPLAFVIPPENRGMLTLVVRMRSSQQSSLAQIKRQVSALAPTTPVTVRWWSDTIDAMTTYCNPRFQTLVLGTFAGLALGLTALGIFAIVAFSVAIRTREMGIRMTVGAGPRSLVAMMVRQSLTPVIAGLLLGLAGAWWAARVALAQLSQMQTRDPATLAGVAVTVALAALLAAYMPARRASRVDPITVLREE
jgi:predicted permease